MKGLRTGMLMLAVWLGLTGLACAKQVYFRDGSVLDCESFWRRNGLVVVKVNRDVLLEFAPGEVDLRATMARGKRTATGAVRHKKTVAGKALVAAPSAPPAPEVVKAQPVQSAQAPAPAAAAARVEPKPAAAAPAPTPVVATGPQVQPVPAAEVAPPPPAPLTKEELERRTRENVDMMAQAIKTGDQELMKKAVAAQKSLTQQQRETGKAVAVGSKGHRPEPPWFKYFLMMVVSSVLIVIAMWVVFRKAGHAGVKSLIPVYNYYILMQIAGKPGWWCLLVFVPVVGLATHLLAMLALAEKFQRSPVFGVGLVFLPMIFFPLLAFGGSRFAEAKVEELDFTFSEEPPQG